MWALATSTAAVDGIRREEDAPRAVHMLGLAQVIGPYSWQVVDEQGLRFVAEMRRGRK